MKNNKGFSLVELIVVIAIMAILAAVAVIGVSIYIPEAQEKADNSMLDTLSDSFMAACLSEGVDHREVGASIAIKDGALDLTTLKVSGNLTTDQANDIKDLFLATINGDKITFNMPDGVRAFIATVEGRFAFADKAVNEKVTVGDFWAWSNQLDAYKDSVFNNIDTEVLLGNVNSIIDQVGGSTLKPNEVAGFVDFYKELTGKDYPASPNETEEKELLEALVLYAASISNKDEVDMDMYKNHILGTSVEKFDGDKTSQDFLAAEAMKYAVGMAWIRDLTDKMNALSPNNAGYNLTMDGKKIDPNDYRQVTSAMNSKSISFTKASNGLRDPDSSITDLFEFSEWYKIYGEDAVAGYMGAMGMIDQNNQEVALGSGFDGYADIIDEFLGKSQSE